jgi:hypothetical protein
MNGSPILSLYSLENSRNSSGFLARKRSSQIYKKSMYGKDLRISVSSLMKWGIDLHLRYFWPE